MTGAATVSDPSIGGATSAPGSAARLTRRSFVPTSGVAVVALAASWWIGGPSLPTWASRPGARAVAAMLVAVLAGGLAVLGRRRALRALGDRVVAARSGRWIARAVVGAYVALTGAIASTFVVVGPVPAGAPDAWDLAVVLLGVIALSTVGVWTVVLDGASPLAAVGRIVLVLPAVVLGVGAGLGAGFAALLAAAAASELVGTIPGASLLADGLAWFIVWFAGVWAGTLVSTYTVWSGPVHASRRSGAAGPVPGRARAWLTARVGRS